jgi:MFS family permease
MAGNADAEAASPRLLWLFALAWAGGAVAYVPFLTILLPLRVVAIEGDRSVWVVGLTTFCGAVAASVGNIVFGWLSDRSGVRRPWVVGGLVLSSALLVAVPLARSAVPLILLLVCWQLALNMMLGPLSAWAADYVPGDMTGRLGGLMALAPTMGALSGVIVTIPRLATPVARLGLVAAMVAACVMPALLLVRPGLAVKPVDQKACRKRSPKIAATMWLARLLVQIAESALFYYLFLYFRSFDASLDESRMAWLFGAVVAAALPIAMWLGRKADRSRQPARPLAYCALLSGIGLIALSSTSTLLGATIAYILFGVATSVFLSLHTGQTMRVLPNPRHRGRDLGLFNLTNTIPSLIMPWLTMLVVPSSGFAALFGLLALLALASATLLFALKRLD